MKLYQVISSTVEIRKSFIRRDYHYALCELFLLHLISSASINNLIETVKVLNALRILQSACL